MMMAYLARRSSFGHSAARLGEEARGTRFPFAVILFSCKLGKRRRQGGTHEGRGHPCCFRRRHRVVRLMLRRLAALD